MGIISTDKNLIKLYYNSQTSIGKQTYSYVITSKKEVLGIDISQTKVPGSHWAEIADGLSIEVKNLINTEHPNFTKAYGDQDMDFCDHDWLTILEKHPETLAFPIAIVGEKFFLIKTPTEGLNFLDADSVEH